MTADTAYQPPADYLTMKQAQEKLGVSKATMNRLTRSGELATFEDPRNKRVKLVKVEDVEALSKPRPGAKKEAA